MNSIVCSEVPYPEEGHSRAASRASSRLEQGQWLAGPDHCRQRLLRRDHAGAGSNWLRRPRGRISHLIVLALACLPLVSCGSGGGSSALLESGPRFQTSSLVDGEVGMPYSVVIQAAGGTAPLNIRIESGRLPSGLSLSGGVISGTPMVAGNESFTLEVRDASTPPQTQMKIYNLQINNPVTVQVLTTSLPSGNAQSFYSNPIDVQGGSPPYLFEIVSGTLPSGISLNSGTGVIAGVPSQVGSFPLGLQVTDAIGQTGSGVLMLLIQPATANPIVIQTQSLPTTVANTVYSATLSVSGGTPPYQFDLESGSLPAGLALNPTSGEIAGTSTQAGTANFTLRVRDSGSGLATTPMSLTVQPAINPLTISTSSLPAATSNQFYTVAVSVTGGVPPYQFSISNGSLPGGINLNGTSGTISGTASQTGTSAFTLRVQDSQSAQTTAGFSVTVLPAANPLAITTSSLPAATEGTAFNASIVATGGTAPYSFSLTSGSLPAGISMSAANGSLSGTPSQAGTFSFTVQVQDNLAAQATAGLSLVVQSVSTGGSAISLVTNRNNGVAPLSVFFDASGTTSTDPQAPNEFRDLTYHWDFSDPGARHLSSSGPLAAHVFENPGSYSVQLTVTEPGGNVSTQSRTIVVDDPDVVFAGSNTICFSNTNSFVGAPAGAQLVTTSSFNVGLSYYQAGRRLLFRRGDSFSSSSSYLNQTGAGIIGAFGQGTNPDQRGIYANNPRVVCSGSGPLNIRGSEFRIMDLQFEDPSGATDHVFDADRRLVGGLLLRLKTTGFRVPIMISYDVTRYFGLDPHSQNTIADCHTIAPRINGYYISGHQLALVGNKVERCVVSHLVRITYTDGCVVDSNELHDPGPTRLALKLHAHQDTGRHGQFAQRIVIRGNHLKASSGWIMVVGPKDNASNEALREILIERNLIVAEGDATQAIRLNCREVTVRNNVFADFGSTTYSFRCVFIGKYGPEPAPQEIEVYHNTYYGSVPRSNSYVVEVATHLGGPAMVKNNLAWGPLVSNVLAAVGSAQYDAVGNLAGVDPRFNNIGAMDFTLSNSSPALSAGQQTMVRDDFSGRMRSVSSGAPDVGAHER